MSMELDVAARHLKFFESLASETRLRMIELLMERKRNIKELAETLGVSSAVVTKHVQQMEEAGIVHCESVAGVRGTQKLCSLKPERVTLVFRRMAEAATARTEPDRRYTVSIPVGQYAAYDVKPTCGLVSAEGRIGLVDDPRYFADMEHVKADHLWFAEGFVEYRIPNYLVGRQSARELEISLEICSEAPRYNENWPSDITFSLNGVVLGAWTCPGDYGSVKGVYTPDWWAGNTQHGLLKTIRVTEEGTFIDGLRMSSVTIGDLSIKVGRELLLRIASLPTSAHCGGVSLFGKRFGNYSQDIEVTIRY